jgi:hypothetical protein
MLEPAQAANPAQAAMAAIAKPPWNFPNHFIGSIEKIVC